MEDVAVLIVGGDPSGLTTAACLTNHSIPYIILEREDCSVSLWRKHTYDCLKLHSPKEVNAFLLLPILDESPTYIPKAGLIDYLDAYAAGFDILPRCNRNVMKVEFDHELGKWRVEAPKPHRHTNSDGAWWIEDAADVFGIRVCVAVERGSGWEVLLDGVNPKLNGANEG